MAIFHTDAASGNMSLQARLGDDLLLDAGIECCPLLSANNTMADPNKNVIVCLLLRTLTHNNNTTQSYWANIKRAIASGQWAWFQANAHAALNMPEGALVADQSGGDAERALFVPYSMVRYDLRDRAKTTAVGQFGKFVATVKDDCVHLWMLPYMLAYNPVVLQRLAADADARAFYADVAAACKQCYSAALTRGLLHQRFSSGMRALADTIVDLAVATHRANLDCIAQEAAQRATLPPPINIVAVASATEAHKRRRPPPHAGTADAPPHASTADAPPPLPTAVPADAPMAMPMDATAPPDDDDDAVDDDDLLSMV